MKSLKLNWMWIGIIVSAIVNLTLISLGIAFLVRGYAAEESLPGIAFIAGGFIGLVLGVVIIYSSTIRYFAQLNEELDEANSAVIKAAKEIWEEKKCNKDLRKALESQDSERDEVVMGLVKQCEGLEAEADRAIKENTATLGKLYDCEQMLVEVTRERDQLRVGKSRLQAEFDALKCTAQQYQALHGRKILSYEQQIEKLISHLKRERKTKHFLMGAAGKRVRSNKVVDENTALLVAHVQEYSEVV